MDKVKGAAQFRIQQCPERPVGDRPDRLSLVRRQEKGTDQSLKSQPDSDLMRSFYQLSSVLTFVFVPDLLFVEHTKFLGYGVATISRMLKNIGLFCKRAL